MKDSGIEWIGEIPKDWKIDKMNRICSVITDYVASGSFADLAENVKYLDEPDYAMLVRTMDVSNKGYSSKPVYINEHAYNYLKNSNLFGGELLLPNIGGVGEIYIVPKLYDKMSLAPNSIIIKTNYYDKYYYYFFYCEAGALSIKQISQSTAQLKFNKTQFKQIKGCVPPLLEQQKIADFLDEKCSHIDSVLEKIRASIDEYKHLKQSVITQAVTKGVRPNRPMKDSGIEWIGEIPQDWSISKIKFVAKFNPQYTVQTKENDIVTFAPMECIKNGYYNSKEAVFQSSNNSYTPFQEGDIVIAKVTPCFENGNIAIMENLSSGYGYGSSELFVLRPFNIQTRFLFYYLQNESFKKIGCSTMTGTGGLKRVSPTFVQNYPIPHFNKTEQNDIVNYLDVKCAEIDKLITKKEQLITELETYKKSLIYEYVTGKKEVK